MGSNTSRSNEKVMWNMFSTGPQRLMAGSGGELINAVEHLICGTGAVESPTVAQGLALAGGRVASLVEEDDCEIPAALSAASRAPWVYHHTVNGCGSRVLVGAFELMPGTLQEAVDQCLVAHYLTEHLNEPGVCHVDQVLLDWLGLASLPELELVVEILGQRKPGSLVSPNQLLPSAQEVLQAAQRAFEVVSEKTGRSIRALSPYRVENAEFLLITLGWITTRARLAVDMLREVGIRVGLVSMGLVRPFPSDQLREILKDRRRAIVLDFEAPSDGYNTEFFHLVRTLATDLGMERGQCIRMSCPGPDHTIRDQAALIGFILGEASASKLPAIREVKPGEQLTVGIAPGGLWGESLLLEMATHLGRFRPIELRWVNRDRDDLSTLLLRAPYTLPVVISHSPIDVLTLPQPSLLASTITGQEIAEGGTVLLRSRGPTPQHVWEALGQTGQEIVRKRRLHLWWVDALGMSVDAERPNEAARHAFLGAALAASRQIEQWANSPDSPAEILAHHLEAVDSERSDFQAVWLRKGAEAVQSIDLAAMTATAAERTEPTEGEVLPIMMASPVSGTTPEWQYRLRQFHLNTEATRGVGDASLGLPLRPSLIPMRGRLRIDRHYPFLIQQTSEEHSLPTPLRRRLEIVLDELDSNGTDTSSLRRELNGIIKAAREVLRQYPRVLPLRDSLQMAFERLGAEGIPTETLPEQLDLLQQHLPSDALLVGFGPQTALRMCLAAAERQRRSRLLRFSEEIRQLTTRLADLLAVDRSHTPDARARDTLLASFGPDDFFDAGAVTDTLLPHRGPKPFEPERRKRIENASSVLSRYLQESKKAYQYILVHSEPLPEGIHIHSGLAVHHHDAIAVAMGLFDGLAERMVEVFRAIRVAHLELENQYDPEHHDELLAGLTWQSCRADELVLMPPIIVMGRAERLTHHFLADFSQLLRTGRIIQVMLEEGAVVSKPSGVRESAIDLQSGLGMMAVAHREAYVAQTTLARPAHLLASLERMFQVPRPGVTVVAVPDFRGATRPTLVSELALDGRATPCFRYDPDRGARWSSRFDLEGNPQLDRVWPRLNIAYLDASGERREMEQAITFADVAALDTAYRKHFWIIPGQAYSDEQVDLATYLARQGRGRREIPYIWVVDEHNVLRKAVITFELALTCRDYLQAWQTLQELGGITKEEVRRAAEAARVRAESKAAEERRALEEAYQQKVEKVRVEAASEAIDRLVSVLLDQEGTAPLTPSKLLKPVLTKPGPAPRPAAPPPVLEGEPSQPPPTPTEAEEEEALTFDEPYIDSFLCTSCHDCVELNPLLFKYNANKQAYIADPKAGTFAELVQAAEKCPARCIHPGKPRQGDPTVTDELVKRASKFA